MARPTKERTWLPADHLRIKAFARELKASVLPDASLDHEDALLAVATLQAKGILPNISPGRWSAWWKGHELPSAANVRSIRHHVPQAAEMLDVSVDTDALRRHFFALDLTGLSTVFWTDARPNAAQLGLADLLLGAIGRKWLPEIRGDREAQHSYFWLPCFDAEPLHHPKLPTYLQYFSVLEPASVITWLLVVPELLPEGASAVLRDELALDLFSCALAIDFRLCAMGPTVATCSPGLPGIAARFVTDWWLGDEQDSDLLPGALNYGLVTLPVTDEISQNLIAARARYRRQMQAIGASFREAVKIIWREARAAAGVASFDDLIRHRRLPKGLANTYVRQDPPLVVRRDVDH